MTPTEHCIAAKRAGLPITVAMVAATINSLPELDAYRVGLSERGALDADAMAAIRDRQDYLRGAK